MLAEKQRVVASLREKEQERSLLLATLEMWHDVEAQGYDPENVKAFTFETARLTSKQKREYLSPFFPNVWVDGNKKLMQYNTLILQDGSRITLDPPIVAPEQRIKNRS